MQKISFLVKAINLLILVFIIGTRCVPNSENPVPVKTFNVNIKSNVDINSPTTPLGKGDANSLLIDNDSILFTILYQYRPGFNTLTFKILYNAFNGTNYEYLTNNITSPYLEDLPYGANVLRLDSGYYWKPAHFEENVNGFNSYLYKFDGDITVPVVTLDLPLDTDRYFVFRKQKASSYQYYWLKARLTYDSVLVDSVIQYNGTLSDINSGFIVNILNGKFQMDSIITGL